MKEHWKRRNQHKKEANRYSRKRSSRTLLPRSTSSSSGLQQDEDGDVDVEVDGNREEHHGIPAQLLCGVSHALSSSRPDPFQTCPVHLTSQHQKLLHHCTYEDQRHLSL